MPFSIGRNQGLLQLTGHAKLFVPPTKINSKCQKIYHQNQNGHAELFVLPSKMTQADLSSENPDNPLSCTSGTTPGMMIMVGQFPFKIRRWPRRTWVLHDFPPPSSIVGAQLSLVGQFVPHQLPPHSCPPSPRWPRHTCVLHHHPLSSIICPGWASLVKCCSYGPLR